MSTPEYIQKHPELPEEQKQRMMSQYNQAKKSYESKVARAYYSSPKFAKDLTYAATNVGVRMGLRQALGICVFRNVVRGQSSVEKFGGDKSFSE